MVETNPFAAARIAGTVGLSAAAFIYGGGVAQKKDVFGRSWDVVTASPGKLENAEFSICFKDNTQGKFFYSINRVIFTQLSVQETERVQVSSGFNENVHISAFGREPKRVSLAGHVLYSGEFDGFGGFQVLSERYNTTWRAFKAAQNAVGSQLVSITGPWTNQDKSNVTVNGVALGLRYSISSVQNSILDFSMDFVEVSQTIKPGATTSTSTGSWEWVSR